jgi:hypothetical protein
MMPPPTIVGQRFVVEIALDVVTDQPRYRRFDTEQEAHDWQDALSDQGVPSQVSFYRLILQPSCWRSASNSETPALLVKGEVVLNDTTYVDSDISKLIGQDITGWRFSNRVLEQGIASEIPPFISVGVLPMAHHPRYHTLSEALEAITAHQNRVPVAVEQT